MSTSVIAIYPPSAYDTYKKIKPRFTAAHDAACDQIQKATKGLGTDEKALIKVLTAFSADDRALIALRYQEKYKTELKELLKSEASGDFGFLLQLLVRPLPEAEAYILHQAMVGLGTSQSLIYPIIMGRTNEEIEILRKAYFERYNKDLAVDLDGELSGDFRIIISAALQAPVVEYKESFHTRSKAEEDADKLYKAGEGKWGTDEKGFLKVLLASPPRYLQLIDEVYQRKYKSSIKAAIKNEFSGTSEAALLYFFGVSLDPRNFLAEHIENTMKGIGTDEKGLAAAIVRYHFGLPTIAHQYHQIYKTTLKNRIKGEVSGDYGELLVQLLDAPASPPVRL